MITICSIAYLQKWDKMRMTSIVGIKKMPTPSPNPNLFLVSCLYQDRKEWIVNFKNDNYENFVIRRMNYMKQFS